MRWICWASALLAVCTLACSAEAVEPGCGSRAGCFSCEKYGTMGAPACAWQFAGWKPGCQQCQPSACDNAWAGYCREKSKRMSFWYRVGTKSQGCGSPNCANCQQSMSVTYQPAAYPGQPAFPGQPAMSPGQPAPIMRPIPDEIRDPVQPGEPAPMPPAPAPETTWRWRFPWRR